MPETKHIETRTQVNSDSKITIDKNSFHTSEATFLLISILTAVSIVNFAITLSTLAININNGRQKRKTNSARRRPTHQERRRRKIFTGVASHKSHRGVSYDAVRDQCKVNHTGESSGWSSPVVRAKHTFKRRTSGPNNLPNRYNPKPPPIKTITLGSLPPTPPDCSTKNGVPQEGGQGSHIYHSPTGCDDSSTTWDTGQFGYYNVRGAIGECATTSGALFVGPPTPPQL